MELVEKNPSEQTALRLVADNRELQIAPELKTQFVNFIFFRVSPDWRKLSENKKNSYKREFIKVFDRFNQQKLIFSYSLVGFDSKADLMFWRISDSLDVLQEMTAKFFQTHFGSYLETADNYLSVTKKTIFLSSAENDQSENRSRVIAGNRKYLFVYPCGKHRDWQEKTSEEREQLIEESFMIGKKIGAIKIHLTHAFGFSDQEFIVSFETDEPKDFLALAEELNRMPADRLSLRGKPIYTCRQRNLQECLDALG